MAIPRRFVVAGAAYMIQVVCFGIAGSIGVFNTEFLHYFDSSTATTSMIGAVNIGMLLGAGPIASFLMRRMSYRKVALLGAVLSSLGLSLSIFAPNVAYLNVFYGFLAGLGFCFLYIPSHTLSGVYFDKHRSLATGIVTSGSGLGGAIFPVMTHFLIQEYGWRGSMLILAGINLHTFVFALMLKEAPVKTDDHLCVILTTDQSEQLILNTDQSEQSTHVADIKVIQDKHTQANIIDTERGSYDDMDSYQKQEQVINVPLDVPLDVSCDVTCDVSCDVSNIEVQERMLLEEAHLKNIDTIRDDEIKKNVEDIDTEEHDIIELLNQAIGNHDDEDKCIGNHDDEDKYIDNHDNKECAKSSDTEASVIQRHLNRADIQSAEKETTQVADSSELDVVPKSYLLKEEELKDTLTIGEKKTKTKLCYVLCNFQFITFFLSNVMWNIGSSIVLVLLPEYLIEIGMTKANSALGLTILGAAVTVGGALGGAIGNLKFINRELLYFLSVLGNGVFTLGIAVPFLHSMVAVAINLGLTGVLFGMLLGLLVAVTADILGVELLGDGMGFLMFANGIGCTIGPPIAGFMRDATSSYTSSFYAAGIITIFGAVIMIVNPLKRRMNSKHKS